MAYSELIVQDTGAFQLLLLLSYHATGEDEALEREVESDVIHCDCDNSKR
jgi:hypothetical protein